MEATVEVCEILHVHEKLSCATWGEINMFVKNLTKKDAEGWVVLPVK